MPIKVHSQVELYVLLSAFLRVELLLASELMRDLERKDWILLMLRRLIGRLFHKALLLRQRRPQARFPDHCQGFYTRLDGIFGGASRFLLVLDSVSGSERGGTTHP